MTTEATPIPMLLSCPECRERHIDRGIFQTKIHHTHECQKCGHVWRVALVPTVGVQFLPWPEEDPLVAGLAAGGVGRLSESPPRQWDPVTKKWVQAVPADHPCRFGPDCGKCRRDRRIEDLEVLLRESQRRNKELLSAADEVLASRAASSAPLRKDPIARRAVREAMCLKRPSFSAMIWAALETVYVYQKMRLEGLTWEKYSEFVKARAAFLSRTQTAAVDTAMERYIKSVKKT